MSIEDEGLEISHGNSPNELFPGYYPLDQAQRRDAYRRGLISLDANAMLDLYRFSTGARNEFFEILDKVRPRLFITHQAGLEFYRNRLSVVEDRINATEKKCAEIAKLLKSAKEKVQEFANRHQIDPEGKKELIDMVELLESALTNSIKEAGKYDLTVEDVREAKDEVLKRLQKILSGRVGDSFSPDEYKSMVKLAERRREDRIPPGYEDNKGTPELRAGDFILWRQLMNEAALHDRPVLLISSENKEDWVLKDTSNKVLGPRPELVLEMQEEAKVSLLLVTVVGLLKEAPEYLGTTVSPSTIAEAESLPPKQTVVVWFSSSSREEYDILSQEDKDRFMLVLSAVAEVIAGGRSIDQLSNVRKVNHRFYILRWSGDGQALFEVQYEFESNKAAIAIERIIKAEPES